MEETMTLARMADTIVVGSFVILCYCGVLFILGEMVTSLLDFIQRLRERRKAKKAETKEAE